MSKKLICLQHHLHQSFDLSLVEAGQPCFALCLSPRQTLQNKGTRKSILENDQHVKFSNKFHLRAQSTAEFYTCSDTEAVSADKALGETWVRVPTQ